MDTALRDILVGGGLFSAIVGLLVWLNKDSQKKLDMQAERADARQRELIAHYENRIGEIVERAEARIASVTDQFVAELKGNREAAIQRRIEDQQMHEGYQKVIRELTKEVESLTGEVRKIAAGQTQACKHIQGPRKAR